MKCISIFKCNPQIEVIDKSHCHLEHVPNFQNYSRSLEELFLDANKLTLLNENVFKLTKLRRFSFRDNAIQDIPSDIAKLVNLAELDCSRNEIENIPEQIKFLRGLQACDFSGNNIEYIPNGLVQLKNLTHLSLNYCLIKKLPDDIGLLKSLESLDLRENEIEKLPASITSLESLKKLDLGGNVLIKLPDDLGRLKNLEYLILDSNRLETLPPKTGQLDKLQCLDLSKQKYGFRYLPEEIGGLTSLTDLHLSENHLQSLPDGIRDLKSLTVFKVDGNFLSELNPNIGDCRCLQELVLTSNQISMLPSSIGYLTDLRSLNVDDNMLRELSPQIGSLKRLGILSLRDNQLTNLPIEIGNLESVKVVDLSGNRLEYLPVSITNLNLNALWLSKNQAQPLPRLQIDELPNSDTRVLTCYLLPQQSESGESVDVSRQNDSSENERYRQVAVSFDSPANDDTMDDFGNDAQFVRHDTPHPRELKARHQKLFNTIGKNDLAGHDNASFNMGDNGPSYGSEKNQRNFSTVPSHQLYDHEPNGLPDISTMQDQPVNYHREAKRSYDDNNENQQLNNDKQYSDCFILDILVRRSKNHKPGLGLSIAGGKDTPPFKDDDEGIFVSKVTKGGPAEAAGIKIGDKILAVNHHHFYDGITHHEAVDIFRGLRPDCVEFSIRILRDPNDEIIEQDVQENQKKAESSTNESGQRKKVPYTNDNNDLTNNNSTFSRTSTIQLQPETNARSRSENIKSPSLDNPKITDANSSGSNFMDASLSKSIIYTTLVKDYKHDLGLILENRVDDGDCRAGWSNIVIAEISPNSVASIDGKLRVDDRLLSINGADVTGIDLERIESMLNGTERFIRIVVSRGDHDDPLGSALRNMPLRQTLGSWFSSTSNMANRPSLIESHQRPTFGSVSNLQKQQVPIIAKAGVSKPPKPPKPSHLMHREMSESPMSPIQSNDEDIATKGQVDFPISESEKRAAWRRERLKSIENDVEMAKIIAEAQRKKREEN